MKMPGFSVLLAGCCLSVSSALAATVRVAPTGSDHGGCSAVKRTITAGAACLRAGDTLLVSPGTYREQGIDIPSGTSDASRTVVKAETSGTVLILPQSGYTFGLRAWTTLEGVVVDAGYRVTYGLSMGDGSHHIRLKDVEVRHSNGQAISIRAGIGHHELLNVQAHGAGQGPAGCQSGAVKKGPGYCHGVYVSAPHVVIDGGSYHHNAGYGVHVYAGNAADTVVRNVAAHDNLSTGIGTFQPRTTITNVQVYGNGKNGIWAKGRGTQMAHNTARNNGTGDIVIDEQPGAPRPAPVPPPQVPVVAPVEAPPRVVPVRPIPEEPLLARPGAYAPMPTPPGRCLAMLQGVFVCLEQSGASRVPEQCFVLLHDALACQGAS